MADVPVNANDAVFTAVITANAQTLVDFDFLTYDEDDMRAIHVADGTGVRTILAEGIDFTVTGVGQPNGGTITLMGGAPVTVIDDQVIIYRDTIIQRLFDYQKAGDFRAETVNRELDTVFMIMQELRRDIDRSVTVAVGDTGITITPGTEGQVATFDASGNLYGASALPGSGDMLASAYDPEGVGLNIYDRGNLGIFETQAAFAAKNIRPTLSRVTVGYGLTEHDKIRIATPVPVEPWHSQSADGAWWEIEAEDGIRPEMINADFSNDATNQATWLAAVRYASAFGVDLLVGRDLGIGGVAETRAGLTIRWDANGKIRQTKRSVVGAFLTNVAIGVDRQQGDITLHNPQIDGDDYPDPVILVVETATTTTIQFTAASSPSAIDDFYNGMMFQCMEGVLASALGSGSISDYDAATRTVTLAAALGSAPVAGVDVQLGFNDNAMGTAWGAHRVKIRDGYVRNYPMSKMTPPVLGGKGINFEQGNEDVLVDGLTIENFYTAIFASGTSGTLSNGAARSVLGARYTNIFGKNVGSLITVANLDLAAGIPNANDQVQAQISGISFRGAGHAPLRIVGSSQEKSGIINLMGPNGLTIKDVRGFNDASYIADMGGYPTDYAARCGFGLSGEIGAVVWGHARNTHLEDIHAGVNADAGVHVGRVRALGDDAPGGVSELVGWKIRNLNVYGTVARIVSRDENLGLDASQFKDCFFDITVDAVSDVFMPTQFTTAAGLILEITRRTDGTKIIGKAKDILARGNTFADYVAGEVTDLFKGDRRRFVMADDTAVSFTPLKVSGNFTYVTGANLGNGEVRYEVDASPQCTLYIATANTAATTGVLAGTTGVDGNLTFSTHTDGKIYIENRRGGSITIDLQFLEGML